MMTDDNIAKKPCWEWASADGSNQMQNQAATAGLHSDMQQVAIGPYDNPLLNEREKTHGDWKMTSATAQAMKALWEGNPGLSASQREALDMIATKIARIICGDARHEDTVVDIIGYATLMLEDMRRERTGDGV